ncbi:MAG: thiamine phosphate synthase [Bryobacterales bacterium]
MLIPLDRFYPILDSEGLAGAKIDPLELARILVAAGARLVQFRHKAPYTRDAYQQAKAIAQIVQQSGGRYIINDRADIALMVGADGVHLGQDDLPPSAVRNIAGGKLLIGFSTHNEEQLRLGEREPVDYLAIGPIFGTSSKVNPDPVVGVEEVRRLRPVTGKPLVAIGGITRERAAAVLAAGADSLAVLSDIVAEDLPARAQEWLRLTR